MPLACCGEVRSQSNDRGVSSIPSLGKSVHEALVKYRISRLVDVVRDAIEAGTLQAEDSQVAGEHYNVLIRGSSFFTAYSTRTSDPRGRRWSSKSSKQWTAFSPSMALARNLSLTLMPSLQVGSKRRFSQRPKGDWAAGYR